MKLPAKIRIAGIDYTVKFCDTEEREDRWGSITPVLQEIRINPKLQNTPYAIGSLIHEILHAINTDMVIGLKESQIIRITLGLNQVLQDNFLNGDLKKKLKKKIGRY